MTPAFPTIQVSGTEDNTPPNVQCCIFYDDDFYYTDGRQGRANGGNWDTAINCTDDLSGLLPCMCCNCCPVIDLSSCSSQDARLSFRDGHHLILTTM